MLLQARSLFLPLSAAAGNRVVLLCRRRLLLRVADHIPTLDCLRQRGPKISQGLDAGPARSRISFGCPLADLLLEMVTFTSLIDQTTTSITLTAPTKNTSRVTRFNFMICSGVLVLTVFYQMIYEFHQVANLGK